MRARERVVSKPSIAKAIYGLMTVLALLVVMNDHPPIAWRGALTLFGATLAVALVDTYAETIAGMLSEQRGFSGIELREIWRDVSPVLLGAQAPTVVLLLAEFGFFSVERAIVIAQVVCFLLLFGVGWRVGQALHRHWLRQLISGLLLVAIGGLIVGIKAVFH